MDLLDALFAADEADLFYVTDAAPGIIRRRSGKGFSYVEADGTTITDRAERARIASIAIPPAWEDVWICTLAEGHIQATGRDAKGRKQYRYHPRWRSVRDETKFHKMVPFGESLPALRAQVDRDLGARGLSRERVIAVIATLLDETLIRVGNEEYLENETYGLTTLQDDHADINGAKVSFSFRAKHGILQEVEVKDRRLAKLVKRAQELPGSDLFQYLGVKGEVVDVVSGDVNAYLAEATGAPFTAKDFRTWGGTVVTARALREIGGFETKKKAEKNVLAAIDAASDRLGNTRAVARGSYIHPGVLDAYRDGSLLEAFDRGGTVVEGLKPEEAVVLDVLRARAAEVVEEVEEASEEAAAEAVAAESAE